MEETRPPTDQQEDELLDAIARALIIMAKQVVNQNNNENNCENK